MGWGGGYFSLKVKKRHGGPLGLKLGIIIGPLRLGSRDQLFEHNQKYQNGHF